MMAIILLRPGDINEIRALLSVLVGLGKCVMGHGLGQYWVPTTPSIVGPNDNNDFCFRKLGTGK